MYKLYKHKKALLAGLALTAASTSASAAIDVSAAATALTQDGTAALTVIGTALMGLATVAVVFKWAKASMFG